jgi:DNA-damage-inducible protein J
MNKSVAVQARIEPNLKREADHIIHKLGLTASQVVNALYAQIVLCQAIPFELKLPNKTTLEAMNELEHGDPHVYGSVDAMFDDLDK